MRRIVFALLVLAVAGLVAGCVTLTAPGDFGDYAVSLRRVQQDPSPRNLAWHQMNVEALIRASETRHVAVPPGLRCEYGHLLWQQGRKAEAEAQFNSETAAYPAATAFITALRLHLQADSTRPRFPAPMASTPRGLGALVTAEPVATTKGAQFPRMYQEQPVTVLILPPVNLTSSPEASVYYTTALGVALTRAGYYALPFEVTKAVLKSDGRVDPEAISWESAATFKAVFGADAVLFTAITDWNPRDPITQDLRVGYNARLVSTADGEVIWDRIGRRVVEARKVVIGPGYATGTAVPMMVAPGLVSPNSTQAPVVAASSSAQQLTTEYATDAASAFVNLLSTLPAGKYHPDFLKDRTARIQYQPRGIPGATGGPGSARDSKILP